ncbi:MAG: spore coat polysaccharide biosynthesis protein F [Muricauda sp. TMED12]|nr:MAG: spore coat polysaccharide biosynthesis protein F [Muricauda sp. TMED12]
MPRTVAIVQARWGSSRLPGKVLLALGGTNVLEQVLARCHAIAGVDAVCCAVSDDLSSEPVAEEAAKCGAAVTRGPLNDVLERYRSAAEVTEADVVLRVTSDCPLIDPKVCAAVLDLRERENLHYACNNMPPSWPHGIDCEAFTRDALERAAREASASYEREHVTPWIRNNKTLTRGNLAGPGGDTQAYRWTIDYREDYEFLCALWPHLPNQPCFPSVADVCAVLEEHPEIARINSTCVDVARVVKQSRTMTT